MIQECHSSDDGSVNSYVLGTDHEVVILQNNCFWKLINHKRETFSQTLGQPQDCPVVPSYFGTTVQLQILSPKTLSVIRVQCKDTV